MTIVNVEVPLPTLVEAPTSGTQAIVTVAGTPGADGPIELHDSATAPTAPPDTYLRFERDPDGDVQAIYLGTVD